MNLYKQVEAHLADIANKLKLLWQMHQQLQLLTDKIEYPRLIGAPDLSDTLIREKAFQLGCVMALAGVDRCPYEATHSMEQAWLWRAGHAVQRSWMSRSRKEAA